MGRALPVQRYVAFLRGINLGKRRVTMSRLAALFEGLGHADVATFLASGNIIFSSRKGNPEHLEMESSKALRRALGYEVEVFVRRAEELGEIVKAGTFRDELAGGATVYVGFMRHALDESTKAAFEAVRTAEDTFRVINREYYWICRTRLSESKVWDLPEAKRLRLPVSTLRNMSTVRRLVAKFPVE